jgi:hypothetical protein
MRVSFISLLLSFIIFNLHAQTAEVRGRVFNSVNNEGIPFANVVVLGTDYGTVSDENGNYVLSDLPPGLSNMPIMITVIRRIYFLTTFLRKVRIN